MLLRAALLLCVFLFKFGITEEMFIVVKSCLKASVTVGI